MEVVVLIAMAAMACGLLLVISGVQTRAALPGDNRVHHGLGRIVAGIVALSTPVAFLVAWLVWQGIGALLEGYGRAFA